MIFSKSRPVKIVLVGTGGTGGYIVPQLYNRYLHRYDKEWLEKHPRQEPQSPAR